MGDTSSERFSSRWAMLAAALGIAIGTGNIWRFPRVAANNGGGVFILLWMGFLFLWSVPLLATESAIGRTTRRGTLGAFTAMLGPAGTWMGGFVALITAGIMCYYSVVTGWCLRYLSAAVSGTLEAGSGPEYWQAFAGSPQAGLFHLLAALITAVIVLAGIRNGIELSAKIFIPVLGAILILCAARALLLPGASAGVSFLFHFDPVDFLKIRVWLEALSQSAWSTGAGWGLLLTYSVYARTRERVVSNALIMGLGNNTASLLAALAVIPTVFAMLPPGEAEQLARSSGELSTGLTFIWIPRLLQGVGGGKYLLVLFFLALVLAALSSLISMVEMMVRNLIDLGLNRKTATWAVMALIILAGAPSALNNAFFANQDWVWGLGLLVNGLFFSIAVWGYGAANFRRRMVNLPRSGDIPAGKVFETVMLWLIPLQFVLLLGWWFYQSLSWAPENWWNPLSSFSIGSCLVQWSLVAAAMWLAGPLLAGLLERNGLQRMEK